MKLNTSKEVWIARIIAWVLLCILSSGILFVTTFMIGPALFAVPDLDERIAVAIYCPGAESSTLEEGTSMPTTSSPSGSYGHTVEVTCYYADGSTKVIRNEQFALAAIGGVFGIGGLIGLLLSMPLMLIPFFLIRRKKG
ncbi:MAG: hypothetical protein DPW18_15070 [Chloroflexi bacterium]|nr:hypothetical protein [Chloroflexota bacterium]MDL1944119.1 hypothetical protein [Chloroflexi bacterium CFX2]